MTEVIWDDKFKGLYKNWSKKHPELIEVFRDKLELLLNDTFSPSLRTHSLSGVLKGFWSMRINYEYRLVFKFMGKGQKTILLVDIGTHDEVY